MSLQEDAARRLARRLLSIEERTAKLALDVIAANEKIDELQLELDHERKARNAQVKQVRDWAHQRFTRWVAA